MTVSSVPPLGPLRRRSQETVELEWASGSAVINRFTMLLIVKHLTYVNQACLISHKCSHIGRLDGLGWHFVLCILHRGVCWNCWIMFYLGSTGGRPDLDWSLISNLVNPIFS